MLTHMTLKGIYHYLFLAWVGINANQIECPKGGPE